MNVRLDRLDLLLVLRIRVYQLLAYYRHVLEISRHGKVTHVLPPYRYGAPPPGH